MRISILLLLSSLILHPACFGETVRALNFGSTEGAWWHGQYFEGMPCPAAVACRKNRGVSGTDEPALFESLIEGPLTLELTIPNGTYDATLFFAEPEHNPQPARTFDVLMQNELKIDSMDVMRYRDGQSRSALTDSARHCRPGRNITYGVASGFRRSLTEWFIPHIKKH